MSDVLAISFDSPSSPFLRLKLEDEQNQSMGWGFAWYPNDHPVALVTKDPVANETQILMSALTDWKSFRSTSFFCKLHAVREGYTHHEVQPFSRSFAGQDWLMMHNGDLDKQALEKLHSNKSRFLEPLGKTDSELAFCYFLSWALNARARQISDLKPEKLLAWFEQLDEMGCASIVIGDSNDMVCYQSRDCKKPFYYCRAKPPHRPEIFESSRAVLEINDPRDEYRTAFMISSLPFSQGEWNVMEPSQLMIISRGAVIYSSHQPAKRLCILPNTSSTPEQKTKKIYRVTHSTAYTYSEFVDHSTHVFRLKPVLDRYQNLDVHEVQINVEGEKLLYEDVFGNSAMHYSINKPYKHLKITSSGVLMSYPLPSQFHHHIRQQTRIPLVWMPWQRQMMQAYLLPHELPETQLVELTDYAMSFVKRNDYQLLNTLKDLNGSIYQDYEYVQGETSLNTTAFEVYTSRRGVCQDFSNLFICLVRLLSLPARYRMGYIYTGVNYENTIQSEASHAWVEVYLPYFGWQGFDPTNGIMVGQDHIRVACGRNYLDATPTSGTIFKGGGLESLEVDVKIELLNQEEEDET